MWFYGQLVYVSMVYITLLDIGTSVVGSKHLWQRFMSETICVIFSSLISFSVELRITFSTCQLFQLDLAVFETSLKAIFGRQLPSTVFIAEHVEIVS